MNLGEVEERISTEEELNDLLKDKWRARGCGGCGGSCGGRTAGERAGNG